MVQNAVSSNPGVVQLTTGKLAVHPAANGYLFSNQGNIRQRNERNGLRLSYACLRYSGPLTHTATTGTRPWETLFVVRDYGITVSVTCT